MSEAGRNIKVASARKRTFMHLTLGKAIRILLCDVKRYRFFAGERCECEDPHPRTYYCVYGECEIVRCERCKRVISWKGIKCYFPYQKGGYP